MPQASAMSILEREVVSVEEVTVQYEELLKQHKASGSQKYTSDDIKEALMATQKPAHGLSERNAEVLVWLLSHNDDHLKHAAVKGIANCATFTKNQVRFFCVFLTISSIYTHLNTLKIEALGKHCGKRLNLLKMSNFTSFHDIFYAICIGKPFNPLPDDKF